MDVDSVFIASGATLGGQANLGQAYLTGAGTVWPGAQAPSGASTISTYEVTTQLNFEFNINGTIPGQQYDQLVVQGLNSLDGSLTLNLGYTPAVGDHFEVIDNQGPFTFFGNFTGLPEGATFWSGGNEFQITYLGGTGDDVVLTVVSTPEPSTLLGIGAFAAGGLLCRRRTYDRRRAALT
jgi:hypothetical protein